MDNDITYGISFKLLEQSGIRQIYDWIQKPHVKQWWLDSNIWPEFKQKFESKLKSPYRACFVIYIENKPVGYIQSYIANKFPEWQSEPDGTYGMDIFIGETNYIGKGYGSRIVAQFVKELFKSPKVLRVIINPDIKNSAAIRAYERVGFRVIKEIKLSTGTELLMEIKRPII